ncbi:MAG: cation:proton antiporter [Pseudomonadota bacterium]
MSPSEFLDFAIMFSLLVSILAFLVVSLRLILGPSLADRVLALDSLLTVGIGFIAIVAIKTGYALYVDVAIALGLVGFLATVALARFILQRGESQPKGAKPGTEA